MVWLCSGGDKGISLQNLIGPNYSRRDLIQINFSSRHPLNGLDQSLSSVQFLIMILFASEAGAEIICKIEPDWAWWLSFFAGWNNLQVDRVQAHKLQAMFVETSPTNTDLLSPYQLR